MWSLVDRLQGAAPEPPRCVALGGCFRPGPGPQRWGAVVPDAAQPLARIGGPEGDQLQTSDVPGECCLGDIACPRGAWVTPWVTPLPPPSFSLGLRLNLSASVLLCTLWPERFF